MKINEIWEDNVSKAISDQKVNAFVRSSLLYGYKNIGVPLADEIIEQIFSNLEQKNDQRSASEQFESLRSGLSRDWEGMSIKDRWAAYYQRVEAPFIVSQFFEDVVGPSVLEVGTGRGLITMELLQRRPDISEVLQTDVEDYRIEEVKKLKECSFQKITQETPLPFENKVFDTTVVVYVLHHHPSGKHRFEFLKNLARVTKKKIIIFEDTFSSNASDLEQGVPQVPMFGQFLELSDKQKELALSFQCTYSNKVDGGGSSIPAPCTFRSFTSLKSELQELFPKAHVRARFLGIPKSKVYLNSEAVFVVDLEGQK